MPTNKRERQRENRAKKLEEQKKQERQRKLRKRAIRITLLVAVIALVLFLPAILSDSDESTTTTTTPTATSTTTPPTTGDAADLPEDYQGFRDQPTACGAEAPPPLTEMTFAAPEDQGIAPEATVTATIATSCGDIVAELDPSTAPETVNSFVFLAREGYFDGSVFHRIAAGFVIQGGDPTAIGNGGPGYVVPDEFPELGFTYGRGVLAMANGGPNSTGSQFFIVNGEDVGLLNTFSAFGRVRASDETLDRMEAVPVGFSASLAENSLPLETVYIESVEVVVGS